MCVMSLCITYIHTEAHLVVGKTRQLVKHNLPFIIPNTYDWSLPHMMQACWMMTVA